MNKAIFSVLILLFVGLCHPVECYAISDLNNSDANPLRTFTPYHKLQSVFASFDEVQRLESSASERQITNEDINLIASVVQAESRGEPFEGKVGVASVILNRLNDPQFPKSIKSIVFQKNAFSCVRDGSLDAVPDVEAFKAVDEALSGNDPTGNAIFFYNPATASCSWIKNVQKENSIKIGNHVFFR